MELIHNNSVLFTILFAALATYFLRAGGLLLAQYLPSSGRMQHFMNVLPGTLMLSLIAPSIYVEGVTGAIAAGLTALCAYKTHNIFLAMTIGVIIVAASRYFGGV